MARLTGRPGGVKAKAGLVLGILTAEPTSAESENYTNYVGSGLTSFGGLWMESDGLHWSYNGTEKYISESYSGGGGGTGVGDMDGVYSNGRTVTLDEGAIVYTDATTGALDSMSFVQSGAKSGNVLDLSIDAALTGKALNIDMNLGIAAPAIYIDNGGTARTGSDIQINDDSTGTHSSINIDKSGAGTSTSIDITSSYAGSPAGSMIALTYGNGCSLDTSGILVTKGTGVMTGSVLKVDDASTGSADIIDINLSGVYTGDVFDFTSSAAATGNVFFINLDNAVAMTAFHVEGSGARTQPMIEVATDCTGSSDLIDIAITGVSSGNIVDIDIGAAVTGNVIDIDLNLGVASKALYIDCGGTTRTVPAIDVKFDGDGNVQVLNVDVTNTGSGNIIDIDVDSVHTGNAIDITYATAAATGDAIAITTGTNVAGNALQITTAGARTAPVINIVGGGTDAGTDDHIILITQSAILNSNMIQLTYDTAASDGDAIGITMGTNVAGSALAISGAGARSDDLIKIDDGSTGSGSIFDINLTAAYTGTILDISTGDTTVGATPIIIARGTGTNTVPSIKIDDTGTSSGGVIDINVSGIATTAAVMDMTYSAAATYDAISVTIATAVAARALTITGTGSRTDDLIKIDDDSTGNSQIFDINLSGIYTGNVLDITYSVAAATGNAVDLNMGTNVAGIALDINSAATGVNNKGSAINIDHSGALAQGATVIRLDSTSNPANADGNIVELIQRTGAGQVGNNLLYLSASGTNVEAIKVDDGNVVFDENLTVSGATALGTLLYKDLTETVAATNVISASESGSVFFLSHATEFVSTLPAPAAGLHFNFIVANAPETDSYTIVTNGSSNIILGQVYTSAGADGDSETSGADTITFVDSQAVVGDRVELFCDGTNWFAYCFCDVAAGITITTAS
jgi:hypothetical protein